MQQTTPSWLCAISSEVVEMFWDGGETFPNRVIKDSVLN